MRKVSNRKLKTIRRLSAVKKEVVSLPSLGFYKAGHRIYVRAKSHLESLFLRSFEQLSSLCFFSQKSFPKGFPKDFPKVCKLFYSQPLVLFRENMQAVILTGKSFQKRACVHRAFYCLGECLHNPNEGFRLLS